ncbi:MAG: ornithine acetyltransferase [Acidobacteria bacterium]|nr:MAG: ornithine acetyltransferase [Acidobacteriota bacterium]
MPAWERIEGNLATPAGFRGAAVAAGIKKVEGSFDLALLVSDARETSAAGTFTTNLAAAAPVILCRKNLRASGGRARAVVVNSGNANACTGRAGLRTAEQTARAAAKLLGVPAQQVLVASTGVIGIPLRSELILSQLPALKEMLSTQNASAFARAIMTTDTFPKSCVLRSEIEGKAVHLAGVTKGAGMIHPPNDSVMALASGLAGVAARPGNKFGQHFFAGLTELCQTLAKMIARDGEGASKLVTIEVLGARNASDAERIARSISNSPLVKTAIAGSDPNWGRIMCAAGYSGAKFDPTRADILVNHLFLCRNGLDAGFDEGAAKRELDQKELTIRLDLHQGKGSARMWTCDFTRDYIDINASYRT